MEENVFPRELSEVEKECINFVLPENKPGYKLYRTFIDESVIHGIASGNRTGFLLGRKNVNLDDGIKPTPLFALGNLYLENKNVEILVYQIYDEIIEVEINFTEEKSDNSKQKKNWTYSEWNPGMTSPEDDTLVREIKISGNDYTLVVAEKTKRIWLNESKSGVNHFIPVTNYFNELMRSKNIRDPKIALKPGELFNHLNNFKDDDLKNALMMYDKYLKRFSLKSI